MLPNVGATWLGRRLGDMLIDIALADGARLSIGFRKKSLRVSAFGVAHISRDKS